MYDAYLYARTCLVARSRTQRGASAVEYGLLVALIAVFIIGAVSLFGGSLSTLFSRSAASIS
jgi:pilus assembly protein Flp/PilA